MVRVSCRVDIDAELGMAAGVRFQDPAAPWGMRWSGIAGAPSGIYLNYRIPYSTNIRITASLPDGVPNDIVICPAFLNQP